MVTADEAMIGVMAAGAAIIMMTVAVTTTVAAADAVTIGKTGITEAAVAAVTTTGIGSMTGTEAVIHRLPGLEAIIPTEIPADAKNSKESADTYVSALLREGIKQGFILCLHAMFIVCLQFFYWF